MVSFQSPSHCSSFAPLLALVLALASGGVFGDYDLYGDLSYLDSDLDDIFEDVNYDTVGRSGGYPVCASDGYTYQKFPSKCLLNSHNLQLVFAGKRELTQVDLKYCSSYSAPSPAQEYYAAPSEYSSSPGQNSYAYAAASGPYGAKASAEAPGPRKVAHASYSLPYAPRPSSYSSVPASYVPASYPSPAYPSPPSSYLSYPKPVRTYSKSVGAYDWESSNGSTNLNNTGVNTNLNNTGVYINPNSTGVYISLNNTGVYVIPNNTGVYIIPNNTGVYTTTTTAKPTTLTPA